QRSQLAASSMWAATWKASMRRNAQGVHGTRSKARSQAKQDRPNGRSVRDGRCRRLDRYERRDRSGIVEVRNSPVGINRREDAIGIAQELVEHVLNRRLRTIGTGVAHVVVLESRLHNG